MSSGVLRNQPWCLYRRRFRPSAGTPRSQLRDRMLHLRVQGGVHTPFSRQSFYANLLNELHGLLATVPVIQKGVLMNVCGMTSLVVPNFHHVQNQRTLDSANSTLRALPRQTACFIAWLQNKIIASFVEGLLGDGRSLQFISWL